MFDDSGFGGSSMFDSNHDGHLNAFERDHAECFLHDCDTFDQIKIESSRKNRNAGLEYTFISLLKWFVVIFAVCLLDAIICSIGRY